MKKLLDAELDRRWPNGVGSIEQRAKDLDKRAAFLDGVLWQINHAIEHFKQ